MQNSAETLTQKHALTQSWLFSCRAKNTWKVGVFEAHGVLELQLSTWQNKSCGSSWSSTFYSPLAARPSPCRKLLQLQSPPGGHPTCMQDSKSRKHVINHRNTLLSSIKKCLVKCKQTVLALQRNYLTLKEVLHSAALHGFTHPRREQTRKQIQKRTFIKS